MIYLTPYIKDFNRHNSSTDLIIYGKMKILEIIPQLGSGGAERFTVDLCNELVKMGHDVSLIQFFPLDKPEYAFYLHELNSKVNIISLNKKNGLDISLYGKLLNLIKKIKPDIVHSHVRAIFYLPLAIVQLHKKIRFFHTVHSDAAKEALGSRLDIWIRKISFKKGFVKAITISPESKKSFEEYYGITAPIIYNGRNIPKNINISEEVKDIYSKLRVTSDTKILLNVAHIDKVKRQNVLARAVTELNNEGYDISLALVGREEDSETVEEIKKLENHRISILGARTNPLEFMKVADAFCLSSQYEGLPISLIESLGVGTIPICTPVGGIKNIITDGENGFLSTDLSEDSIKNAIIRFLSVDSAALASLKVNIKNTYQSFTMKDCAKAYESLFLKNSD